MAEKKKVDEVKDIEKLKEALLEDVKKEAAKIIEDAKAQAKEEIEKAKGNNVTTETAEQLAYANELVEIKLFKDRGKYADDVTVIHNGVAWQIKRGVKVKVPRKIYQIIEDSERQLGLTADLLSEMENDFEEKSSKL